MEKPEKIYACKYCGLKFENYCHLASHVGNEHKCSKHCKCDICGKEFNKTYSLTYHINKAHLNKYDKMSKGGCFQKVKCPKCGRDITNNNFNKHLKVCGHQKQLNKDVMEILSKCIIKDDKYICPLCNKEYSKMGIGTHIFRNHTEKGKSLDCNCAKGYKNGTRVVWNKGLTKETDERIKKGSEKIKESWKLGKYKDVQIKDKEKWKQKIAIGIKKYISKNPDKYIGTYKRGFVKTYIYKNIKLQGTYELKFAIWCDKNNINFLRNKIGFDYFYLNKTHKYFPDFYLPDLNEYVEVKGYKTIKDYFKWTQFPKDKKLNIVDSRVMKKLGIACIIKDADCKNYLSI